jgi:hypothetical protein
MGLDRRPPGHSQVLMFWESSLASIFVIAGASWIGIGLDLQAADNA